MTYKGKRKKYYARGLAFFLIIGSIIGLSFIPVHLGKGQGFWGWENMPMTVLLIVAVGAVGVVLACLYGITMLSIWIIENWNG